MIASPLLSFTDYCSEAIDQEVIIQIMMGDLQRIDIYGRKGFQIPQEIPVSVWEAFEGLKKAGYTKHLLPEGS